MYKLKTGKVVAALNTLIGGNQMSFEVSFAEPALIQLFMSVINTRQIENGKKMNRTCEFERMVKTKSNKKYHQALNGR